jgi:amino acid permease
MNLFLKILFSVTAIAAIGWCYVLGQSLSFKEHVEAYAMVRNVSGVMFGVFGLWVGLLYPDLRKKIFRSDGQGASDERQDASENERQANSLLQPFFCSLAIFLLSFVAGVAVPLGRHIPLIQSHPMTAKGISYATIGILALVQIWTIWNAIQLTDVMKKSVDLASKRKQLRDRRRQNKEKVSEEDS